MTGVGIPLKIRVITPKGEAGSALCDSIRLLMSDDENGKNGGSIGIRHGHEDAVIALSSGPAVGLLNGETVFTADIEGGFATVKNDLVTIVTDSLVEINTKLK